MPATRSSVPAPRVVPPAPEAAVSASTHSSGFGRWLLVLAAGLIVVSVLGYRVLRRNRAALAQTAAENALAEPTAAVAAKAAEPALSATVESALPESAPAASATAEGSAAEPAAASAASASASAAASEPTPNPSASAASAADPASDIRKVTVKSKPPKVRFFHFGKQVGITPFVLEFKPGERHAYEAGLPGYGTRKVVIDGSKPLVVVGLTREKP